jgi:ribosomal protein L28
MANQKEDEAMTELIERIRQYVRSNSEAIYKIKQEAKPHISPKCDTWRVYRGHKFEATKWLIVLHLAKGNLQKVDSHAKGNAYIVRVAKKALKALEEKVKKELCHA